MKLVFGQKDSALYYLKKMKSLIGGYSIYSHECDCEYCNESGIEKVVCGNCRKTLLTGLGDVDDEYVEQKIIRTLNNKCPHCQCILLDNEAISTFDRIMQEYGIKSQDLENFKVID